MLQNGYRTEMKYRISRQEYAYLREILSAAMQPDPHSGPSGEYTIRSLYFDTPGNRNFHEKENGYLERRKIRLRAYSPDAAVWKLEIKNRNNAGILKQGCTIPRDAAVSLIAGNVQPLLSSSSPVSNMVYSLFKQEPYRPAILIDYEREAYVLPVFNVRITFDKNIRASVRTADLGLSTDRFVPLLPRESYILEVKFTGMLPSYLRRMLGTVHAVPMSVSKYCLCRSLLG